MPPRSGERADESKKGIVETWGRERAGSLEECIFYIYVRKTTCIWYLCWTLPSTDIWWWWTFMGKGCGVHSITNVKYPLCWIVSSTSEAQSLLNTGPSNVHDLSDKGVQVQNFCKTSALIRLQKASKIINKKF